MADKKFNIKDQLAGIAALIAAVVAIGGGFAKYGELTTKINALELASKKVDTQIVAVLEEKVAQLESHEHEHELEIISFDHGVESTLPDVTHAENGSKDQTPGQLNIKEKLQ